MGSSVFIIAEAGVNHNGSLAIARKLVDAAADAGADAVKFQTFKADKMISYSAPKAEYQKENTDANKTQLEMLRELELSYSDHIEIAKHCSERGIEFMSTPFDMDSLDFLVSDLQVTRLKVASGEITNAPLLLKAARTGKPIILSTGMSTLGEVEMALGVLAFGYTLSDKPPSIGAFRNAYISPQGQAALQAKVALLHCTTEYPAPFDEVNLRVMDTLRQAFGLPVGYSDHTQGTSIPIAAAARGAVIIEKHFTLDRNLPGPDHKASLEPGELREMVVSIRRVEKALGNRQKIPVSSEIKNAAVARKSLAAITDIGRGEKYTSRNLGTKRPGNGVSPYFYWDMLGRTAVRDYDKDEQVDLW